MVRYGGGRFGFVELFPIVSHDLAEFVARHGCRA